MTKILRASFLALIFLFVATASACRQDQAPTATLAPIPTVANTVDATAVLPATATATLPPTATSEPTEVPATATAPPTPTLAPTATSPPAVLRINSPAPESEVPVGTTLEVSGEVPAAADGLFVSLEAAGITLTEALATLVPGTTTWQVPLTVPDTAVGPALLRAALADDGEEVVVPVLLTRPAATSGPVISLSHPDATSTAVSGYALIFQGQVQSPIEGQVTIEVRYEDCETVAATQTFDVGEGGQWWGFVAVPQTVFGPACALAYTGEIGSDAWRLAQTPIEVVPDDDPAARGVLIGNFPDSDVPRGEPITVYGTAFNAPSRQVQVQLIVAGNSVAQGTATADRFGYWEIDLSVPAGAAPGAEGEFVASLAYADGTETAAVPFTVVTAQ